VALQAVASQQVSLGGTVVWLLEGSLNLEMIAPARQFNPVVSKILCHPGHLLDAKIGPLPGKKRHWSCHESFTPWKRM
jgi:hypothetical protein